MHPAQKRIHRRLRLVGVRVVDEHDDRMALAAAVIYIAEQRALAEQKRNQDELALTPVGREGLLASTGTRAY